MAIKRIFVVVLLTAVVASLFAISPAHGMDVIGRITSDANWNSSNSPYSLTGPLDVASGVTLTIQPGVTVNLNNYYIQVDGTLVARGTSFSQITLNSGSIKFTQTSSGWVEQTGVGCIIEYANLNSVSVTGDRNPIKLNQDTITGDITVNGASVISSNSITGQVTIGDSTVVWDNTIKGGILFGGLDLSYEPSNSQLHPIISGNTITGGAGYYDQGIECASYVLIEDNTISGCNYGVFLFTADEEFGGAIPPDVVMQRNTITDNNQGIHVELYTAMAHGAVNPTIISNTISNNKVGLYLDGTGYDLTFQNNNLQGNSNYSIQLASGESGDLNATNNWWGTTNSQTISQSIYDSNRDFNLGTVNYAPALTAANPQASPQTNMPMPTPAAVSSAPTQQPTSTPEATGTASPEASSNRTEPPDRSITTPAPSSGNIVELGIFVALIVIIALLVTLIVLVLKKRQPQPYQTKS